MRIPEESIYAIIFLMGILLFALLSSSQETHRVAKPGPMTPTNVVQFYGTNVFKIRLEMAERFCAKGDSPEQSLHEADLFVHVLLSEDRKELYDKFQ